MYTIRKLVDKSPIKSPLTFKTPSTHMRSKQGRQVSLRLMSFVVCWWTPLTTATASASLVSARSPGLAPTFPPTHTPTTSVLNCAGPEELMSPLVTMSTCARTISCAEEVGVAASSRGLLHRWNLPPPWPRMVSCLPLRNCGGGEVGCDGVPRETWGGTWLDSARNSPFRTRILLKWFVLRALSMRPRTPTCRVCPGQSFTSCFNSTGAGKKDEKHVFDTIVMWRRNYRPPAVMNICLLLLWSLWMEVLGIGARDK